MREPINRSNQSSVRIKILIVSFDFEIDRREIPAFRAAIVEKVGRENVLFHNHVGRTFRYGYPLIQYKVVRRSPTMICINQGSEEILKFFEQTDWSIVLNGRPVDAQIKHLHYEYFHCGFAESQLRYRIRNWFALNEKNFARFIQLDDESEKREMLQRILTGNMISFAKSISWDLDRRVTVTIPRLRKQRLFNFKEHQMVGFDLDFTANLLLPDGIGLGKSVSRGFGVLGKVR